MSKTKIGTATHCYKKINVCIVDLIDDLKVGDTILFERGGEEILKQKVESLELNHEKVESAKKGDEVGIKTEKEIKEGAEVYKL